MCVNCIGWCVELLNLFVLYISNELLSSVWNFIVVDSQFVMPLSVRTCVPSVFFPLDIT